VAAAYTTTLYAPVSRPVTSHGLVAGIAQKPTSTPPAKGVTLAR